MRFENIPVKTPFEWMGTLWEKVSKTQAVPARDRKHKPREVPADAEVKVYYY